MIPSHSGEVDASRNSYIQVSPRIHMSIQFQQKQVWISAHAIKRARERDIIFPDMVHATILGGKVERFGKNFLRFCKKYKHGVVICIGEDVGDSIIIKTIEWGRRT